MEKEKTPTEKLHDDIRKMKKSEKKTDDEIVRIYSFFLKYSKSSFRY